MKKRSLVLVVLTSCAFAAIAIAEKPVASAADTEACAALDAQLDKVAAKNPIPVVQTRACLDEQGKLLSQLEVKLLASERAAFLQPRRPDENEARRTVPTAYIDQQFCIIGKNGRWPSHPALKTDLGSISETLKFLTVEDLVSPHLDFARQMLGRPKFAELNPQIAAPLQALLDSTDPQAIAKTGKIDWVQNNYRYVGKVAPDGLIEQMDVYLQGVKRITVANHYDDSIVIPPLLASYRDKGGNPVYLDLPPDTRTPPKGIKSYGFSFNLTEGRILVMNVAPHSPAAKSGLVRATVITSVNGTDLSTLSAEATKELFAADKCHLKAILPDDSTMEIDLEKSDPASWSE